MTPPISPAPIKPFHNESLEQWSILGWPKNAIHTVCGQRAVMLVGTVERASYECCGTSPDPEHSMYGPSRCGTFEVLLSDFANSTLFSD